MLLETFTRTPSPSLTLTERPPFLQSPCRDKRHMEIWAAGKNCSRLPSAIILGPQKTGTTALQFFLKTHPNMSTSFPSKKKYEEVQFFSSKTLYAKGIEWSVCTALRRTSSHLFTP